MGMEIVKLIGKKNIPGVSVFAYRRNGYQENFQLRMLSDQRTKVVQGTMFSIASLSKQITAAAILGLASRNNIQLDDDLFKLIEKEQWVVSIREKVSVGNILRHTAGMSGVKKDDPLFTPWEWLAVRRLWILKLNAKDGRQAIKHCTPMLAIAYWAES